MFSQDSLKNIFLILVIIIVFSGLGFYAAYFLQDGRIEEMAAKDKSTIDRLNNEVLYLRNIFNDLVIQYEIIDTQINELQDESAQQGNEYGNLSLRYVQLNNSYQGLLNDYDALNFSYSIEKEAYREKTRVRGDSVRVFFNNVSLEHPLESVVSLDGPHVFLPTNCSRLLGGAAREKMTITLSWSHVEEEPDLNATLIEAQASIESHVNETGSSRTLVKDGYRILYANFTVLVDGETEYVLISTWYLSGASHHYLCVVQPGEDTVVEAFTELIASFSQY